MTKLCDSIDTLSMAYLDDELAAEELRDLELHLIDCAECRAFVDGERVAIAELRRKLAPPAMPDLVRARLIATLDTEDAIVSREERGQRFASWLLPGVASVVAVAALSVFVVMNVLGRGAPGTAQPQPSIAEQVVQQQMKSPRIAPSMRPPSPGVSGQFEAVGPLDSATGPTIEKVASWDSRFRDREVATQLFQVTLTNGDALAVQASVFDATGMDLTGGECERVRTSGLDLCVGYGNGAAIVIYQSANNLGYVFSTSDMTVDALVSIVAGEDLVTRVAPPH